MFSGFLGKAKNLMNPKPKDAVDSRGLEVVEDDPDTTWGLWQNAVAGTGSALFPLQANLPLPCGRKLRAVPLPIAEGAGDASERTTAQLT